MIDFTLKTFCEPTPLSPQQLERLGDLLGKKLNGRGVDRVSVYYKFDIFYWFRGKLGSHELLNKSASFEEMMERLEAIEFSVVKFLPLFAEVLNEP